MAAPARSEEMLRRLDDLRVVKRDGSVVPFDRNKVVGAVSRCFRGGLGKDAEEATRLGEQVARSVCGLLCHQMAAAAADPIEGGKVGVEHIQRLVIQQLWAAEHFEAAEHYTLYREQRRQLRVARPISDDVRRDVAEDAAHFPEQIQYYQFVSKFARWNESTGRRETWRQACDRVFGWMKALPHVQGKIDEATWDWLYRHLYNLTASPALRVVQMAGPALERCQVGAFNCWFVGLNDLRSFAEMLYVLMGGGGCGFSVEAEYVEQLPRIRKQRRGKTVHKYQIADTTEGWCEALLFGLQCWFDGEDVEFDYSLIRKAGTRLKIKGGRASGPEPLRELLTFARDMILGRQGEFLRDIDVHDLACKIGKIVQVGGVRRASCISLSDLSSTAMRDAKSGNWYPAHKHRTMANNSAVYEETPGAVEFLEEWLALAKSGSGERGIYNRGSVIKNRPARRKKWRFGCNPCGEVQLRSKQPCNLSICIARPDDTPESLADKIRAATLFGTIQAGCTDFKYLREEWKHNAEEEALLGVDITGQMDCPLLRPDAPGRKQLLNGLKELVLRENEKWADRLGIKRAAAATTVKPSGDSSVLFNCGSGIHAWFGKYFLRRVRERKDSPVAKLLMDAGVPWMVAPEDESLVCFEFPRKAPDKALTRRDQTAVQQLENWLVWQTEWAEHSVSATIYIDEHEWLEAGQWVHSRFDHVTGLSFLPRDNGTYTGTPYEDLTEEQYRDRMAKFPKIDWAKLSYYETDDQTESAQTVACSSGVCSYA